MPRYVKGAKIAFLDFSLQKAKMHLGIQVIVDDPDKLEAIRKEYVEFAFVFYGYLLQGGGDNTTTHREDSGSGRECGADNGWNR